MDNLPYIIIIIANFGTIVISIISIVLTAKRTRRFWEDHPRKWNFPRTPFRRYKVTTYRNGEVCIEGDWESATSARICGNIWGKYADVVIRDRAGNIIQEITNG